MRKYMFEDPFKNLDLQNSKNFEFVPMDSLDNKVLKRAF